MISQYDWILLHPPTAGELEIKYVREAVESGWVAPAGPDLVAFEEELAAYMGAPAALALSSGSAALHLGLLELGVGPGDLVVVQTSTFAATAFAVVYCGATPVFCDIDEATGNLDPDLLGSALEELEASGQLPAAVLAVDLFGYTADYERLRAVCEPYGVPILEDAAEAIGSRSQGRGAGTHGDLGVYSFNGNKIMTTSGGGALVGEPERLEMPRKLSTQAREDFLHYEHTMIGYNYRMSNLLAAVGRAQLETLDDRIDAREAAHDRYVAGLPELEWFPGGVTDRWNRWISVCFLPEGVVIDDVCRSVAQHKIEVRPFWKPMHQQPVFADNQAFGGAVADDYFARGLCLPSGHGLTPTDLDRVIGAVAEAVEVGLG